MVITRFNTRYCAIIVLMSKIVDSSSVNSVSLASALGERYLAYALSTITSRSLPDVRDGLKPVQRRLLFAMRELKLDPKSGHKKCARVVGDVIGKFHPHGDSAVYDALVRLAQSFAVRWPLVEGQGNFGNIDGDNAAAMRYTEARLTDFAISLLEGIEEDAVDFRSTYDGEEEEPIVLPAAVPNLLANGATGIAVGLATNIPPHNVEELCDAVIALLKDKNIETRELVNFCPGPDFPTGGILVESRETICEAYETGRGSFRLRARWEIEELPRGQWQVVITEIPYQVQKSKLIERIAELLDSRQLALLGDIRDESTEDIRLVLEPKNRNIEAPLLMETLFKHTDLEVKFGLNMNVLDSSGVPGLMGLKEMLLAFIKHRYDVLNRRTNYRLTKISNRLAVLDGYLIVYLNLDAVIQIIRESDEPKAELIQHFGLSDLQVEAILNMRLRSLRKLEEFELRKENEKLTKEKNALEKLKTSSIRQKTAIKNETLAIKKRFGKNISIGDRRTKISGPPKNIDLTFESIAEREPVTVICSAKGWIRTLKGHIEVKSDIHYKEGDQELFRFFAMTSDRLLVFATNGRFYTLNAGKLPSGRGYGQPLRLMVDIGNDNDVVSIFVHHPERKLLVASVDGRGFFVSENNVIAQTRTGKKVLNCSNQTKAALCVPAIGDSVAVVSDNRRLLIFQADELPILARGRGVILQRSRDSSLIDARVFWKIDGLTWRKGQGKRVETKLSEWFGKRGNAGRIPPKGFPRSNRFD